MSGNDVVRIGNAVPLAEIGNGDAEAVGDLDQGVAALDGVRDPASLAGTAGGLVHLKGKADWQ